MDDSLIAFFHTYFLRSYSGNRTQQNSIKCYEHNRKNHICENLVQEVLMTFTTVLFNTSTEVHLMEKMQMEIFTLCACVLGTDFSLAFWASSSKSNGSICTYSKLPIHI